MGIFGRPWTGGGRSPLHFLKTIEDIAMKLTPLIKRHEINLLLLSYFSCDVTKRHLGFSWPPSWILGLCQNAVKTYFFASNLLNNLIR